MKKVLICILQFVSLWAYAQTDGLDMSLLNHNFQRERCVLFNDEPNEVSTGSKLHKTSLHQKDAPIASKGTPQIVVCLANFSDLKFSVADNDEALVQLFQKFFNGHDVRGQIGSNPRSLREYFEISSDGQFSPNFTVLNPVTVNYTQANAKSDRANFRNLALQALNPQVKDRISDFDSNGDGIIDGVIIVFPDMGANTGGNGPHACTWSNKLKVYETTYATQMVAPEKCRNGSNIVLNGIGLFAHEMSHMLGIPDFYPTANVPSSGFNPLPGMDYWSLMDYGEYTANGFYPTPFTAYEKMYLGWKQPVELDSPCLITGMKGLSEGGDAYIIYNDKTKSEYYILENRNSSDPLYQMMDNMFGSGLMIYHVNEDETLWWNNRVNVDKNQQNMTIIPANGHFESIDNYDRSSWEGLGQYYGEAVGHLWPLKDSHYSPQYNMTWDALAYYGIQGNNDLTDQQRTQGDRIAPAATLYNANTDGQLLMHKPIRNIRQDPETNQISFIFGNLIPGDVNVDGTVDIKDIMTLQKYIINGTTSDDVLGNYFMDIVDLNNDGKVSVTDMTTLIFLLQ